MSTQEEVKKDSNVNQQQQQQQMPDDFYDDYDDDDDDNANEQIEIIDLDIDNYQVEKQIIIGSVHNNLLSRVTQYKVFAPKSQKKDLPDGDDKKDISESIMRYYKKRKTLFSKIDQGIKLDEESWFSVTPENIAKYLAKRLTCKTVFDGLCGVGGNTIQFAFTCEKVICNDIDPVKVEYCKHNSQLYGVQDKITFLNEDILNLKTKVQADLVFLSPPWGGVDYLKDNYDLVSEVKPDIVQTIKVALTISQNIVLLLPKNTIVNQIAIVICQAYESLKLPSDRCGVEIERLYLGNKFKFLAVYLGQFSRKIHLFDEVGYIFKLLNDYQIDFFKYKKLVRFIQKKYGMIKLLDFVFSCQKVKNIKLFNQKMIDKFIDYLLTHQIITNEELIQNTDSKKDVEQIDEDNNSDQEENEEYNYQIQKQQSNKNIKKKIKKTSNNKEENQLQEQNDII